MNPGFRKAWTTLAEGVAALSFAVMFFAFILQVVSRYVFNAPIAWTLELCSISYVWIVFWTCDILVPQRQQIVFDVLYNWFKPGPRRWVAIFNTASLGLIFLAAVPGVLDYIHYLGKRSSMLLHVRMDLVYSCFAIFMIAVVVGAAIRLRRLASARWQTAL
ncbi:MAG: C4-dicarboxylate transporter permease [Devosia sp.]|nr:C4-dicarboxylate transporter permease [Devosia sp.]